MFRKWWVYVLILLALVLIVEAGLFVGVTAMASRMDEPAQSDTIIVLGSGIDMDGRPKPMLQYRLDHALSLYEQGYAPTLIMTGAQGDDEPMPEADAMKAYLVAKGVPADVIYCDPNSYNTQQNLENAKAIMDENGMQSAVIVTNAYHLWRSLRIAEDLGIQATGGAARNANSAYYAFRYNLRETLSWIKYLVTR